MEGLPREDQIRGEFSECNQINHIPDHPQFIATTNYFSPREEQEAEADDDNTGQSVQPEYLSPPPPPPGELEAGPEYELQDPQDTADTELEVNRDINPLPPPLTLKFTGLEEAVAIQTATTASPAAPPPTFISSLHHSHLDSYEYHQADQQGGGTSSNNDISTLRESEIVQQGRDGSVAVSDMDGWETEDEQGRIFSVLSNL
jgi:hypothetical protein